MSDPKKPVAIVDDDEDILDATSSFLGAVGYETILFSSAEAFLAYDRKSQFLCLLTDVNMPGMSGLELQAIVRATLPMLPIFIMTALSDDNVRKRAIDGGAKGILRKPVNGDDLIRCLEGA
ncbi:response regulator [Tardiphaga sp. P9-11]|uniref:response regulator transcription factor n=1 Tax=Tardiphaga sp. P9-11 TaxID=2024614 RepID=UPI0011F18B63|nr:response regulator [Tardiphaga sp. P9-11]KAA0073967.1 response regulator [Tardiphaga sp. P9-11]